MLVEKLFREALADNDRTRIYCLDIERFSYDPRIVFVAFGQAAPDDLLNYAE